MISPRIMDPISTNQYHVGFSFVLGLGVSDLSDVTGVTGGTDGVGETGETGETGVTEDR